MKPSRRTIGRTSALIGVRRREARTTPSWAAEVRRDRGHLRRRSAARPRRPRQALGGKADIYQDYRKLLDRKDIELVINATPDHWHTAINIAACKAGKDVYAEKPLTLTIDEGKILVQGGRADRPDRSGRHHAAERTAVSNRRRAGPQRPDRQAEAGLGGDAALFEQGRAVRHAAGAAANSTGTCTKARRRCTTIAVSGRTAISAGGRNMPAAWWPTGATTTSTSPTGAWIAN